MAIRPGIGQSGKGYACDDPATETEHGRRHPLRPQRDPPGPGGPRPAFRAGLRRRLRARALVRGAASPLDDHDRDRRLSRLPRAGRRRAGDPRGEGGPLDRGRRPCGDRRGDEPVTPLPGRRPGPGTAQGCGPGPRGPDQRHPEVGPRPGRACGPGWIFRQGLLCRGGRPLQARPGALRARGQPARPRRGRGPPRGRPHLGHRRRPCRGPDDRLRRPPRPGAQPPRPEADLDAADLDALATKILAADRP